MKKHFLAGVVLIALAAPLVAAQTGAEIVDRHVAATGGAEKLQAVNSIKVTGKFEMPAMGIEMDFTMMQKRAGKMMIRMNSAQMGTVINATDGEAFWMVNPFAGAVDPTEMPAEAAERFKRQANMDGFFINRDKSGIRLEFEGQEEFNGEDCNKVKVIYPSGYEQFSFFSAESGLLAGTETTVMQSGMSLSVTSTVSDYRDVDGRLVAHRIENISQMGSQVMTFDKVEYNVAIDDSEFSMPATEK